MLNAEQTAENRLVFINHHSSIMQDRDFPILRRSPGLSSGDGSDCHAANG